MSNNGDLTWEHVLKGVTFLDRELANEVYEICAVEDAVLELRQENEVVIHEILKPKKQLAVCTFSRKLYDHIHAREQDEIARTALDHLAWSLRRKKEGRALPNYFEEAYEFVNNNFPETLLFTPDDLPRLSPYEIDAAIKKLNDREGLLSQGRALFIEGIQTLARTARNAGLSIFKYQKNYYVTAICRTQEFKRDLEAAISCEAFLSIPK